MKGYFKINLVYAGGNFVAIVGFINLILFLVSTHSFGQEIELPNDPLAGQKVFQNKECVNCHAVYGKGGRIGRDLGKTQAQRGPAGIVAMMWNHSPEMNQAMQKPQEMSIFSEQEMADLLAYIYFLSYLDELGEPEKGQTVLKQKACLTCHKVGGEGGEVGPPLDEVRSYANPLFLVQEMWNHGIGMSATMSASGIQRPAFTGSEVVDLFAYLREMSTYQADESTYLTPGKPKIGERLFEKKGCLQCHKIGSKGNTVGPDLTQKKFHIGVTQIAAEMWNHGPKIWKKMKEMKIEQPTFQGNEMADLVSYLYFLDFVQLRGDTEMGKVVYVKKGCVECHSVRGRGGNVAIDLARSDKTQNYVKAATAMWNHNRRMRLLMKKVGVVMPRFNENEMKNLLAYLSALNKAQASSELTKKLPLAIKTVEVPILGNLDRCTSCHLAIEDLQMLGEENPLRAHPSNYLQQHPPERFGCTVCHGGRGESLNVEKAHGGNFRKGDLVQTACSKCHSEASLQGAPNLTRGKSLMTEHQCTNCHYIRDFSETELFKPAPGLTGIGSKVNSKWLQRWLKDPKSLLPNATMPRYDIDEKYVDALVGYLMESKNPEIETEVDYPEGDIMAGKGALRMAFCITCHSFNERGGKEAPDLGRTGNKVHEKWLVQMLRNPHHFQPGTTMPQYNFSDQQISDIAAYVLDEFTDYDMLEQDDTTKVPTFWTSPEERAEIGRRIYKELRCANCHGLLEGTDGWRKVGPDLTVIGDKPVSEINFGNSTIPRALPDYLFEKIRNPQTFATPTNFMKMPKYGIPDEDIKDIVLALLSFSTDTVGAKNYRVVKIDSQKYGPQGEFGRLVSKFRCFSCHSFKGRGHNITYDLTLEGSRVKREWLLDYLKLSYTIRPILTIRMPIFNMTDEEAEILTDGFMRETVSPEIPEIPESQLTSEMVDQGKILFEEKGCLACHQLERKGGYVGPSFTDGAFVGEKLRAGWVFSWLKDPQAIKPDVLEPNYGFTDEEALALTAYIMSIKSPEK